jgi:hypothetical protein
MSAEEAFALPSLPCPRPARICSRATVPTLLEPRNLERSVAALCIGSGEAITIAVERDVR